MNADIQSTYDFRLERDAWGQLTLLLADGSRFEGIDVARAFPISAPGEHVSICNAQGHEVLCIEDPSTLPPTALAMIEEALARREFVPIVLHIKKSLARRRSLAMVNRDRPRADHILDGG